VPVALVNVDRGAVADGKQVRAGDQVAAALLMSGSSTCMRCRHRRRPTGSPTVPSTSR
jgi:hypothetical protein